MESKIIGAIRVYLMQDFEEFREASVEEIQNSSIFLINYHYHFKEDRVLTSSNSDTTDIGVRAISGDTWNDTAVILIPFSRVRLVELGYIKGDRFYAYGLPNMLINKKYFCDEAIRECLMMS